jgi:PAS domain S-box-containing protein
LREEAEARSTRDPSPEASRRPTPELLHELQVHQIELEMQNEELRRSRLEIERSNSRYVDLYDFAPVGYLTLTPGGIITGANLTTATLLQVDRARLRGRALAGFMAGEEADRWTRCLGSLIRTGEPQSCEVLLRPAEGRTAHADLSCQFRPVEGSGPEVRVVLVDVSERKSHERSIRESELRSRDLFDSLPDGIVGSDAEGHILGSNRAFRDLWWTFRPQVVGRSRRH